MIVPTTAPGDSTTVPTINSAQTILFADDDKCFQQPVAALLHKCGYRLITASDGKDALQKAREFDGTIHLLLSDIEMPGMNGIELSFQLSQDRPSTRILLISGANSGLLVRNYGWQFLRKPFVFDMLRDVIRDFLNQGPTFTVPNYRFGGST
jgi:two-component system, cell cycle sensor histidine kinase and response regulator CckA